MFVLAYRFALAYGIVCAFGQTRLQAQTKAPAKAPAPTPATQTKPALLSAIDNMRLAARADALAQKFIIADGHVDLPYRLRVKRAQMASNLNSMQGAKFVREFIGIPLSAPDGDFDYVRAKRGGLSAPFMSIYTPSEMQQTGGAKIYADSLITMVRDIATAHPDKFALANSPAEVRANFKKGLISLPLGMENGAPIENDLANVAYFHKRGVRYITLTHGKDNLICDSSYDTTGTWKGVSPFGRDVVRAMNREGIMVDISHVSDSAFYQVLRLLDEDAQARKGQTVRKGLGKNTSTVLAKPIPCIASHSSCRRFTPTFQRNMSDDMIRALGKQGGVIHINFSTLFLDDTKRKLMDSTAALLAAELKVRGLREGDSAAKPVIAAFEREHPVIFSDVEEVVNHIDHAVRLAGVDHVGFGSDFDGVGNTLPTGLKDVSQYPNVIAGLLKRGYSERDIEKICSGNTLRVWAAVEAAAKELQRESPKQR
jgi:membrane dipeptidase